MIKSVKLVVATSAIALLPMAANAQAIGSVVNMSGENGSVLVQRGGSVFSLSAGDPIFAGDVVSTRPDGTAQITAFGSSVTIPSCSSSAINSEISSPIPVTTGPCAAEGGSGLGTEVASAVGGALVGAGGGAAGGGGGVLLAGAATTGVVGAVASSSGGSDSGGDTTPSSP